MAAAPEPNWRLRPFGMDDYAGVRALWEAAWPEVHIRPSDEPAEIAKKCARDPELFLVAEAEGRIVGVIMGAWDGRRGWIHHLAVDGAYRQQGIATALIGAVEEGLRAKGCLKVNLLVREVSAEARRLYRQLGYDEMAGILPMGKEL